MDSETGFGIFQTLLRSTKKIHAQTKEVRGKHIETEALTGSPGSCPTISQHRDVSVDPHSESQGKRATVSEVTKCHSISSMQKSDPGKDYSVLLLDGSTSLSTVPTPPDCG